MRGAALLVQTLLIVATLMIASALLSRALGHSWYDPWCCNANDCQPISPDDVVANAKGFQVKGKWFVPYGDSSIKQSQDRDFHACEFPAGTLRCFYVPGGGV